MTPPAWLVYVTPLVALFALLVSALSFVVSWATYRRAAPRVNVLFFLYRDLDDDARDTIRMLVSVYNRGLSETEVDGFILERAFLGFVANPIVWFMHDDHKQVEGQELPAKLPANSRRSWAFEIHAAGMGRRKTTNHDEIMRRLRMCTLKTQLGGGRQVKKLRINLGILDRLAQLGR